MTQKLDEPRRVPSVEWNIHRQERVLVESASNKRPHLYYYNRFHIYIYIFIIVAECSKSQ